MLTKIARFLGWTLLTIGLLIFISFNLLVIWIATGPRSLKEFIPQIESRINESQSSIDIKVGDLELMWDGFKHPITAKLKKVHVYNKITHKELASFEVVSGSADLLALMAGKIRPSSIGLYKPEINLYQKMDGSIVFDLGQSLTYGPELPTEKAEAQPLQPLEYYIRQADIPELQFVREFRIIDGVLNIGDTLHGTILTLTRTNIGLILTRSGAEVSLAASVMNQEQAAAGIFFRGYVPYHNFAATGKLTVKNFKPNTLAMLHEDLKSLAGADVPITGTIDCALDSKGHLQQGYFKLTAGPGIIKTDKLDGDFNINEAYLEGDLKGGNVLRITKMQFASEGVVASARANIWRDEDNRVGIKLIGGTGRAPVERVKLFWPPWQSPESREWVISNLSKGSAIKSSIIVNIKPGQLELPKLPNEAIAAEIQFENMNVKYKAEHPEVTNANGIVKLNANQLDIWIEKGNYLTSTKLSNARVFMADMMADNPLIEVKLHAKAPAEDIAALLAFPDLALAEPLGINKSISGSAEGDANLAFRFYAPRDAAGNIKEDELIKYKINADLANVSQKKFLGKYDITEASGKLYTDNAILTFAGAGRLYGDAVNIDLTHHFNPTDKIETSLKANGTISSNTLKNIGVNIENYAKGSMPASGEIMQYENADIAVKADMNMTQAEMNVHELDWHKDSGIAAKLHLELETRGNLIEITNINLDTAGVNVNGSLSLNENNELTSFQANNFELGNTKLSQVQYVPISGGYRIHATGAFLDLSSYMEAQKEKDENFSFKQIPALDLDVNLETLKLGENRLMKQLRGTMNCNARICPSANFTGSFAGSKAFMFSIQSQGNRRKVHATAQDAGGFLKGIGVYDNMQDGELNLEGYFDDSKKDSPLIGKLHIWNFQVRGTPVLARLLTLASFGGIVDTLQGKGIVFDKFSTDFTLLNDVITVKDLKNVGNSIGLSADGVINLKKDSMQLKGTIVPSYTINSMLKDVPIVGDILTGGEGIIAAVYVMEGDIDDPNVSVNPLSILAPGFLRKMFE